MFTILAASLTFLLLLLPMVVVGKFDINSNVLCIKQKYTSSKLLQLCFCNNVLVKHGCSKFNEKPFNQICKGTEEYKEWHTVELWDAGNTCLQKCNEFVGLLGPGCCEARQRSTEHTAYCRFIPNGQIHHNNGYDDTKAVLCNAGIFSSEKF